MWEEFCDIYSPVKEEESERWELEEKRRDFINDFYYEKLNFCGCGSPWDVLYTIKKILNVISQKKDYDYEDYWNKFRNSLNIMIDKNNFSVNEGVFQIILNVLNNCDVLEHGSSIGGSWLTDYGKELLEHLNALSDDDLENILD